MQGTGVQTDPYLIETWDDFFDMTNDSQSTYYMLANDLDGNDYNAGIFGDSNIVHTNLDGNGHTIRNLYCMGSNAGYMMRPNVYNGIWKNLTIENVQTNISMFGYITNRCCMYMQNCTISAECYALTNDLSINLTECTVSLKAIAAYQLSAWNMYYASVMTRCSANIRLLSPSHTWGMIHVSSTRLEMQLDAPPSGVDDSSYMTASNSVIAVKMADDATGAYVIKGDAASPSVLDSTLWKNAQTSGITDMILLPTEDMKNADALNAAGFSVVRVS